MNVLYLTGSGVDREEAFSRSEALKATFRESYGKHVVVSTGWDESPPNIVNFNAWMNSLIRRPGRRGRFWKFIVVDAGFVGKITFDCLDAYMKTFHNARKANVLVWFDGKLERVNSSIRRANDYKQAGFFPCLTHFLQIAESHPNSENTSSFYYMGLRATLPKSILENPEKCFVHFLRSSLDLNHRMPLKPEYL